MNEPSRRPTFDLFTDIHLEQEDIPMTTGNRTWGLTDTSIRVAPLILATLLATSFMVGLLVMSLLTTSHAGQQSAAAGVATFDAVKFRAEEHAAPGIATFDAVKFRAEEHAAPGPR